MNTYLFVKGQGLKLQQRRKPEPGVPTCSFFSLSGHWRALVSWQKPHSQCFKTVRQSWHAVKPPNNSFACHYRLKIQLENSSLSWEPTFHMKCMIILENCSITGPPAADKSLEIHLFLNMPRPWQEYVRLMSSHWTNRQMCVSSLSQPPPAEHNQVFKIAILKLKS